MKKLGLLNKFLNGSGNTLPENIIICIVTALAGTFYFYEYFYGENMHTIIGLAITALIVVIWLICSVCSGRDGKIGFLVFSFLYWSAPYIYTLWYDSRDNRKDYNMWLKVIDKAANAILINPFSAAAKKLGTSPVVLAAVLLIVVMGAYIAGFLIKRRAVAKKAAADEELDYDGEYEIDDDDDIDDIDL